MGRPALVLFLLALLLVPSCEKSPSEGFTPVLNVHGLLQPGNTYRQIQVDRTYAIGESSGQWFSAARVQIWRGSDTWDFAYDQHSSYRSRTTIPVQSYDTFELQVSAPGFDTVRAKTVVPDTFSIIAPRDGDTVSVADVLLWTRSRNCAGYLLTYGDTWSGAPWFIGALPDSLAGRLPLFFFAGVPEQPYTLHLLALDTNYFNWMRMAAADTAGLKQDQGSRLVGGLGVLGSAVDCSVRVFVKSNPLDP